jgi:hypothetical protein
MQRLRSMHHIGVARIDLPIRVEVLEPRRGDAEAVAMACSSQLPLFSQNMQKWLPSTKSISTSSFRC